MVVIAARTVVLGLVGVGMRAVRERPICPRTSRRVLLTNGANVRSDVQRLVPVIRGGVSCAASTPSDYTGWDAGESGCHLRSRPACRRAHGGGISFRLF